MPALQPVQPQIFESLQTQIRGAKQNVEDLLWVAAPGSQLKVRRSAITPEQRELVTTQIITIRNLVNGIGNDDLQKNFNEYSKLSSDLNCLNSDIQNINNQLSSGEIKVVKPWYSRIWSYLFGSKREEGIKTIERAVMTSFKIQLQQQRRINVLDDKTIKIEREDVTHRITAIGAKQAQTWAVVEKKNGELELLIGKEGNPIETMTITIKADGLHVGKEQRIFGSLQEILQDKFGAAIPLSLNQREKLLKNAACTALASIASEAGSAAEKMGRLQRMIGANIVLAPAAQKRFFLEKTAASDRFSLSIERNAPIELIVQPNGSIKIDNDIYADFSEIKQRLGLGVTADEAVKDGIKASFARHGFLDGRYTDQAAVAAALTARPKDPLTAQPKDGFVFWKDVTNRLFLSVAKGPKIEHFELDFESIPGKVALKNEPSGAKINTSLEEFVQARDYGATLSDLQATERSQIAAAAVSAANAAKKKLENIEALRASPTLKPYFDSEPRSEASVNETLRKAIALLGPQAEGAFKLYQKERGKDLYLASVRDGQVVTSIIEPADLETVQQRFALMGLNPAWLTLSKKATDMHDHFFREGEPRTANEIQVHQSELERLKGPLGVAAQGGYIRYPDLHNQRIVFIQAIGNDNRIKTYQIEIDAKQGKLICKNPAIEAANEAVLLRELGCRRDISQLRTRGELLTHSLANVAALPAFRAQATTPQLAGEILAHQLHQFQDQLEAVWLLRPREGAVAQSEFIISVLQKSDRGGGGGDVLQESSVRVDPESLKFIYDGAPYSSIEAVVSAIRQGPASMVVARRGEVVGVAARWSSIGDAQELHARIRAYETSHFQKQDAFHVGKTAGAVAASMAGATVHMAGKGVQLTAAAVRGGVGLGARVIGGGASMGASLVSRLGGLLGISAPDSLKKVGAGLQWAGSGLGNFLGAGLGRAGRATEGLIAGGLQRFGDLFPYLNPGKFSSVGDAEKALQEISSTLGTPTYVFYPVSTAQEKKDVARFSIETAPGQPEQPAVSIATEKMRYRLSVMHEGVPYHYIVDLSCDVATKEPLFQVRNDDNRDVRFIPNGNYRGLDALQAALHGAQSFGEQWQKYKRKLQGEVSALPALAMEEAPAPRALTSEPAAGAAPARARPAIAGPSPEATPAPAALTGAPLSAITLERQALAAPAAAPRALTLETPALAGPAKAAPSAAELEARKLAANIASLPPGLKDVISSLPVALQNKSDYINRNFLGLVKQYNDYNDIIRKGKAEVLTPLAALNMFETAFGVSGGAAVRKKLKQMMIVIHPDKIVDRNEPENLRPFKDALFKFVANYKSKAGIQ